ncbi:unnamed protein product, partial [Staurois parvus]
MASYVNPFLPIVISTVPVLLLALITVLVSLGMLVAVSQFPQCQNARRSLAI